MSGMRSGHRSGHRGVVGAVVWIAVVMACAWPSAVWGQASVTVGSKNFTEQEILGELVAQLLEAHTDLVVERRLGLAGTDLLHDAMLSGTVDVYVEYTGTGLLNVLNEPVIADGDATYRRVARMYRERFGLEWLPPIGFNNTYAMALRGEVARELGVSTMSGLAEHDGEIRAGFPAEFMERPDGYPGLREVYGYDFERVVELEIGLMHNALQAGEVDLISAFATDGKLEGVRVDGAIREQDLVVLADDRRFFPPYDAAPVVRGEALARHPEIRDALAALAGTISDDAMRRMNFEVDVLRREPAEVARAWIAARSGDAAAVRRDGAERDDSALGFLRQRAGQLAGKTVEHLVLTVVSVVLAIVIGVPLGVMVHRVARVRGATLAATEVLQTIPSLAMLAFLFAFYTALREITGIEAIQTLGKTPAITALVLYALLPIVLNTYTGLSEVPAAVIEAARGIGMSAWQRLWMVEIPLALPVMIAGIRAATVLTVGIATLSTFIGAGGLGDLIWRGLARSDWRLTLLGAVPAAVMAVLLSLVIRMIERRLKRW
ncbi:MAG: glycine betaine ABC transporter substrate-binding protein [Phycisphaerales bacterium]